MKIIFSLSLHEWLKDEFDELDPWLLKQAFVRICSQLRARNEAHKASMEHICLETLEELKFIELFHDSEDFNHVFQMDS